MAADLEHYRNREQTYIKHQFLTKYLQAAAYKTLQGRSKIFNFVDAFAGPWKISDKAEYSDASFDQAINTLEAVRADLRRSGVSGLKIRFCLCEKKPEAIQELRTYAEKQSRFEISIFPGEFENNLEAIANRVSNGFTFTFIDPTGWKIRNGEVFSFLKRVRGDFLINFMADHINRHAEYSKVMESLGHFLADPDWADDFARLPNSWGNEERVLHLLKANLRSNDVAQFAPDISIMVPRKERIKMRLILGTNSFHGLEVFRDVQSKVEILQANIREQLRQEESGKTFLFEPAVLTANTLKNEGVGGKLAVASATEQILSIISERAVIKFAELAALVLEELPIRLTQLKDLLMSMRKEEKLAFELPARKQKPQGDTLIRGVSV